MLLWHRDHRSRNDLARALLVEPPTAAKTVRRLTDAGFVRTERSTEHGRKIVVSLTEAGRAVLPAVEAIWSELERPTVAGLSADEHQRLIALLQRVSANVDDS